jgi:uncharacterized membrane protein YhaH (DUF805 family)
MEWMILPLKRYAQFTGRSTRREFWMWVVFIIICAVVLGILDSILGLGGRTSYGGGAIGAPGVTGYRYGAGVRGGILTDVFSLAILVPNIAVSVRRLHDTDRSGWWILMPIIPYAIGAIGLLSSMAGGAGAAPGTGMMAIFGIAMVIGLIAAIVLLVWYCLRGTPGPNRFGADPLSPTGDLHETFR